jgi:hypothetical protein
MAKKVGTKPLPPCATFKRVRVLEGKAHHGAKGDANEDAVHKDGELEELHLPECALIIELGESLIVAQVIVRDLLAARTCRTVGTGERSVSTLAGRDVAGSDKVDGEHDEQGSPVPH